MPLIGSGLIQAAGPSFGIVAADSSDSALLAGQDALVCVYDGAAYIYFGKTSGTWKTLWADTTGALLRGDTNGTYAVALASDGPAPFDAAYGFATDRLAGSVSAGTTFTHQSSFITQFVLDTLQTAGNYVFWFRAVESANRWDLLITTGGDVLLREIVNSGSTTRGSAAGAVSGGEIVTVVADDISISVFANTSGLFSYGAAQNFKDETAGQAQTFGLGGAMSDLTAWPRYASTVASLLNKAIL